MLAAGVPQFTKPATTTHKTQAEQVEEALEEAVEEAVEEAAPVRRSSRNVFFSEPRKSHIIDPLPQDYIKCAAPCGVRRSSLFLPFVSGQG